MSALAWVTLVMSTLVGGGLIVHVIIFAHKYGRLTQKIEDIENNVNEAKDQRIKDRERDNELVDKIFESLETIKVEIAGIKAVLPKRKEDRSGG